MDNNFQPNGAPQQPNFYGQPAQPQMGQPFTQQPMNGMPQAPQGPQGPKKNKTGMIVTLIIYIVSVAALGVLLFVMMNSKNKKYDELEEKYNKVQAELATAQSSSADYESQIDTLNYEISNLNAQIDALEAENADLMNNNQSAVDPTTPNTTPTTTPAMPSSSDGNYDGTYSFVGATDGYQYLSAQDFQDQGYDVSEFGLMVTGNVVNIVGGSFLGYDYFLPAVITINDGVVMVDDSQSIIYGTYEDDTITLDSDGISLIFVKQ